MGAEAIQIRGPQREEKETVKGAGAEAIHIKCMQRGVGERRQYRERTQWPHMPNARKEMITNIKHLTTVLPGGGGNPTMTTNTITAMRKGDPQQMLRDKDVIHIIVSAAITNTSSERIRATPILATSTLSHTSQMWNQPC